MVSVWPYGDIRVMTRVTLTTPVPGFMQTPNAAGHGRWI